MNSLWLLATALAVSIDGFCCGLAIGLKKIRIPILSLVIISLYSVVFSTVTMLLGHNLQGYIAPKTGNLLGAGLLFILAALTLRQIILDKKTKNHAKANPKNPKNPIHVLAAPEIADADGGKDIKGGEVSILGIAMAIDASIAAFSLSLMGYSPWIAPWIFGLVNFILLGAGNYISHTPKLRQRGDNLTYISVIIFVLLGIIRLI